MSAPPIGMIMSTPSTSAMIVISQKSSALPVRTRPTMKNTSAMASAMLMMWRNGRMIGAPLIRAESFRSIERTGCDQHRGHADQRVEGGDQFRHRGHRHPARDDGADRAADGDAEHDQQPCHAVSRRMAGERGRNRDRHADHAEEIALARRGG